MFRFTEDQIERISRTFLASVQEKLPSNLVARMDEKELFEIVRRALTGIQIAVKD